MPRYIRDQESKQFWDEVDRVANIIRKWPKEKRDAASVVFSKEYLKDNIVEKQDNVKEDF